MLEQVKLLLGITDDSQDALLTLMLSNARQAVLDYCHINALPAGLEPVVRDMVVQQGKLQNGDNIESIKRGDTSIKYANVIHIGIFTDTQKATLNHYRKVFKR